MFRALFGVGNLTPEKFADLVVEIGLKNGRFTAPQVDYQELRIVDGKRLVNLGNLYASFLRTPRRKRIEFLTNALAEPELPETWDEVKPVLIPVIRDGSYLTMAKLASQKSIPDADEFPAIARKPLASGLFTTLVIDMPHMMAMVQEKQLAKWGVSFEQALDVAMSNLRAQSQEPFQTIVPGVWVAPWGDAYVASRALLPEVLQRVCTDPLVCMPTRQHLFVADPGTHGFEKLVALLEKIAEDGDEHYALTRRIYQLENKTLKLFQPPLDSPASKPYERLTMEERASAYADEKAHRDEIDDDVFYASLKVFEMEDGSLVSFAMWMNHIEETYLPPADTIHFLKFDNDQIVVAWEVPWSLVEATPGMLTQSDEPLARWKTGPFPTDAWLAANGKQLDKPVDNDAAN